MRSFFFFFCMMFLTLRSLTQPVPKIRIDPSQAYGGTVSEYFNNIEYIPLETTKESLFGDVMQLVITDSSIVVYDYDTKYLLFFNLSGKFIIKVKENSIPGVLYNNQEKIIEVVTLDPSTIKYMKRYFSCSGKEVKNKEQTKYKVEEESILFPLQNNFNLFARSCYFPKGHVPKDQAVPLLSVYKGDSLYKSFLYVNPKEAPCFCSVLGGRPSLSSVNYGNKESVYVSIPGEYKIYKFSTDTITPIYELVFPAQRSFPRKMLESTNQIYLDSFRNGKRMTYDVIYGLQNTFINKDKLMFKIYSSGVPLMQNYSQSEYQYSFIYNFRSKRLVSLERIIPDSKSYFLPFNGSLNFSIYGLIYANNYFYTCLSSLQMFTARNATKSKNPKYPLVLQEYFNTQNRKSNPVIVRMKLKE